MKTLFSLLVLAVVVVAGVYLVNNYRQSGAYDELTPASEGVEEPRSLWQTDVDVEDAEILEESETSEVVLGQQLELLPDVDYGDKDTLVNATEETLVRMEARLRALKESDVANAEVVAAEIDEALADLRTALNDARVAGEEDWGEAKEQLAREYEQARLQLIDIGEQRGLAE